MRHPPALLLAILCLVPGAAAGSEEDPEIPGVRDHDDPELDFLGAWLESEREGVRFTVKFGGADEAPADRYYGIAFRQGGERRVAVVAFDVGGDLHGTVRKDELRGLRGAESFVPNLRDVAFEPGAPAYVSAVIPFAALEGFGPGSVLIDLEAATGVYDRTSRSWNDVDGRETQNTFVVQRVFLPAAIQRNLGWVAVGVLLVSTAVIVGLVLLLRRRHAATRSPIPRVTSAPPLAPDAPPPADLARGPGQPKFRIDPRK